MNTNSFRRRRIGGGLFLLLLFFLSLLAWGGLLLFTRFVLPQAVWTFLVFFILLGIGLIGTLSPLIYLITHHILNLRPSGTTTVQALRQGTLISLWVICNLLLRLLHSWSIITAIVSFGIIIVIEILSLDHK